MSDRIRCLLIAPLARGEGFSGEDAYTELLLRHPPEGVEYVFHDDLVQSGRGWRVPWVHRVFSWLGEQRLGLVPHAWVQTVGSGEAFDLVHIHAWAVYLAGALRDPQLPTVISASSAPTYGLRYYKGWAQGRVTLYSTVMRMVQRSLGTYDSYFYPGPARRIVVWSKWARDQYVNSGIEARRIAVIPPGLPVPELAEHSRREGLRLLFVGNDFVRKGGPPVLRVFSRLRAKFGGTLRLTVVSNHPIPARLPDGVTWLRDVPHSRMGTIYEGHSVFVLPALAEGFGISVVEAMSYGLPCVVSDISAMPEIVTDGVTGFTCEAGDVRRLEEALSCLIMNNELLQLMSQAASQRVRNCFSPWAVAKQIHHAYEESMKHKP